MCLFYRCISVGFLLVRNVNKFFMRISMFSMCGLKGYVFILPCVDVVCVLLGCRYVIAGNFLTS
jgi:hypothetical protein